MKDLVAVALVVVVQVVEVGNQVLHLNCQILEMTIR